MFRQNYYYKTIFNGLNYSKACKYISITKLLDSTNGSICDNWSLTLSSIATSILLISTAESPLSVEAEAT